jgi:hypothetical protein
MISLGSRANAELVLNSASQQCCTVLVSIGIPELDKCWNIQGAAEITPTFRKNHCVVPKAVVGCGPFRSVHKKVFSRRHAVVG